MVATSELFDLINRMTKSEKRYFALNAQIQDGSKAYLTLFREIVKLEKYDEGDLKISLENQGFNVGHLAVTKITLTKLLLKSLRASQEAKSPEQSILSM